MSIIYEVNLELLEAPEAEFLAWLDDHVADMLELPGFESAVVERVETSDERPVFSVRYRLRNRALLDDYLRDHAPRMRAEGVQHFGQGFRASRRILTPM